MINISFEAIEDKSAISNLKTEWRNSLTFPDDGYWDAQFDSSQYWAVKLEEKIIGYACVSSKNTLYNFYITPKYLMNGRILLEEFLNQREIKKGLIGTNNPICFSLMMHFQKSIEIYYYTFKDMEEVYQEERDVEFRIAEPEELEQLIGFQIEALEMEEASEDWFRNYIGHWISRDEFYIIEKENEIIGTLEVRTSDEITNRACLGVIVSTDYRNQGYGSYLLIKGKSIAQSRNIEAICSCEKENISSRKAIEKSGFRILHLMQWINL